MKKPPEIVIVDYGVGNLQSLSRALVQGGARPCISEEPKEIEEAAALILPGVGAFAAGMRGLEVRGLVKAVRLAANRNIPILGICLGAQLLLTEGHEFGIFKGLDIIPGKVVPFPPLKEADKIPHIGWNTINSPPGATWEKTIFEPIISGSNVYFVHSFILEPADPSTVLAVTTYGGIDFCSALRRGNIVGCQFHPEKSGKVGLAIIKQFIEQVTV